MDLELLPNEILLTLFYYFNGTDLLRAFYGLNNRFNFLLYKQFLWYRFNFSSISKRDFSMICQQHLPFIADRVISLSLTDYLETPEQINLFLSYIPSFNQFIHLQSLSLKGFRSCQTLMNILDDCHHLCNLTHLKINSVHCGANQEEYQSMINSVWSLPKLIKCNFYTYVLAHTIFRVPTNISSSLQSVSIPTDGPDLNQLHPLFECTPRLKRLDMYLDLSSYENYIPFTLSTLIDLKVKSSHVTAVSLMKFLQSTPHVSRLNISFSYGSINGYEWKEIICNCLPKLQVFRLQMKENTFNLSEKMVQERADELFQSFQTSFWTNQHQWFVKCFIEYRTIYLSTLSETFDYDKCYLPQSLKSTDPNYDDQEFYNDITSILYYEFFHRRLPPNIRFPNIKALNTKLPLNDQFWSIVPSLNRLEKLAVCSHADSFQSQLQVLLDRAPNLRCLDIRQDESLPLQMSLFQYRTLSVRQLTFNGYHYYFNEDECIRLCHSSLGIHCEVLFIRIKSPHSIIYLVKNMLNLRSLQFICEDTKYHKRSFEAKNKNDKYRDRNVENEDELVEWLKDRLSSSCSILKNPYLLGNHILIWI